MAQVRGSGGQDQVAGNAFLVFEENAARSKVAFEVANSRIDGRPATEPIACLSDFLIGCVFFQRFRCYNFYRYELGFGKICLIRNGCTWPILGNAFELLRALNPECARDNHSSADCKAPSMTPCVFPTTTDAMLKNHFLVLLLPLDGQ